jgi:8-oxo-dGTP pyrophosphatase MutT (NUDIX family)
MSEFMTLEEMLKLDGVEEEANVSYIPLPNKVDVVLSNLLAPESITPTSFALPFFDNGDILLAHNRRRKVETPGGHRDPLPGGEKEHPVAAAIRETFEETGAHISDIRPIGFMRSHSSGPRPDGYKYPWPNSCQQFFAALIDRVVKFEETDECRSPIRLTHEEAELILNARTLSLYRAAREALFPQKTLSNLPKP